MKQSKLLQSFDESLSNEINTESTLGFVRESLPVEIHEDPLTGRTLEVTIYNPGYGKKRIFYISDIHLLHMFKKANAITYNAKMSIIRKLTRDICENTYGTLIIAGDVCSDFIWFKRFFEVLLCKTDTNNIREVYLILGNHELWSFSGKCFDEVVKEYKSFFNELNHTKKTEKRCHLVSGEIFEVEIEPYIKTTVLQNDLICEYLAEDGWHYVTTLINESTLLNMSLEDLKEKIKEAEFLLFGGLGFAGLNMRFNADVGLYDNVIDRNKEIVESIKCKDLYEKIITAASRPVVVVTHMPLQDWMGTSFKAECVYVNGHTHHNHYYDDGVTRIFADNQIGYKSNFVQVKWFDVDRGYDIFADYQDGIHEISKDLYNEFVCHKYVDCGTMGTREYANVYLLKKNGYYCFIVKSFKGRLQIMNGGVAKNLDFNDIQYYYDYMDQMIAAINEPLIKYTDYQQKIANDIKAFGGNGHIHGCIIDIDFWNHVYVNPYDMSLTPYWASSMVDKHVYQNVPSLLKAHCPLLYEKYELLLEGKTNKALVVLNDTNLIISTKSTPYYSTDIYKESRIIKKMQRIQHHILTMWDDDALRRTGLLIEDGYEQFTHTVDFSKKYIDQVSTQKGEYVAKIVAYRSYNDIDVRFDDGEIIEHTNVDKWKRGNVLHPNYVKPVKPVVHKPTMKEKYVGKRVKMKNGMYATCVEYTNCNNITILWDDGTLCKHVRSDHFNEGKIAYTGKKSKPCKEEVQTDMSEKNIKSNNNIDKSHYKCQKLNPVICVETGKVYENAYEAARSLNWTKLPTIQECCKDQSKIAAGYHWAKYVE